MQSATSRLTTDAFMAVQVVAALLSGIAQFRALRATVQGVNVSWYLCWDAFLMINLGLVLRARKARPNRSMLQAVWTNAVWLATVNAAILAMFLGRAVAWSARDTLTAAIVGGGILLTTLVANATGVGVLDPYARGCYALCFRAVPQCIVAWTLWHEGGGGLPLLTLCVGHAAILTRIGQVWFSIREAGWDRNRTGSAIAEVGNEISWCAMTVGWLLAP